ncbi:MAG: protein kinase [Thermoanaerobaculales bacterium]|jgi:tetratricopeptide (TPR) repeat protein|nr:protein kinase [Thermoanaerobaculales bacterium]
MDEGVSASTVHPDKISRFEILEFLGEGAMGVVYRARDPVLDRVVALKLIRPELARETRNRERFLRECRAAATINHPGVATIYEAGETDDGLLFLASELVDGETLKEIVDRGALPSDEVISLGIQLADALEAAHGNGAVHRDIKPSNLMLGADGRLKVLDFGLARLLIGDDEGSSDATSAPDEGGPVDMTQDGAVVGTPAYMSPEQASGMKVDARTDIFSAASVLFEMLTGRSPFHSGSVPETLRRVLCEEPPSLESSADAIPAGLEEVLRQALAKARDSRTSTAGELGTALRGLRDGSSSFSSAVGAPAVSRRRSRLAIGGLAGLVVVVVAAVIVWQWSRPTLAFVSQDRLLVADVENLTGDEAFDLALHTALVKDLKQSTYATVFGPQQVQRTLRLMRKPADSVVDEGLGRDVCRFAAIRAMIVPRIERSDDTYNLEAAIVDPQTGRHIDRIRVPAASREDVLLDAIDDLTRKVRTRLGETIESIDDADFPISEVTTSSWEALHHFALAQQEWARGNFVEAERLLQLALDIDPEFATCRGTLGLLLIQMLNQPERGKVELARALADGETLPRDEYLMLRAVNRQFVDEDLEGALDEYQLVSDIYPNLSVPYNNQGRILTALGRYDEAIEKYEKAWRVDNKGAMPLINLAFLYITVAPDAAAAEDACRRLLEIDPEVANYHSLLGWTVAVQGRYAEAREILERAVELDPEHAYAVPNLGLILLAEGNPESAIVYFRRHLANVRGAGSSSAVRSATIDLVVTLSAAGEDEQVGGLVDEAEAALLEETGRDAWDFWDHAYMVQLYAASERFDRAEESFASALEMAVDDSYHNHEVARCCAMLGRRQCVIERTARALEMGYPDPFQPMLSTSMHGILGDPEFMALFPVERRERR